MAQRRRDAAVAGVGGVPPELLRAAADWVTADDDRGDGMTAMTDAVYRRAEARRAWEAEQGVRVSWPHLHPHFAGCGCVDDAAALWACPIARIEPMRPRPAR